MAAQGRQQVRPEARRREWCSLGDIQWETLDDVKWRNADSCFAIPTAGRGASPRGGFLLGSSRGSGGGEGVRAGEPALEYVQRRAREKALAVLATAPAEAVVLGADTTVVLDGECLGKPVDAEDARRMLARLSGRSHEVMTGVCVAWRNAVGAAAVEVDAEVGVEVGVEVTEVEFAAMSAEEITAYVALGEPMDKAGAYAIQGRASRWIPWVRGCYFNVVGLPVARVCAMLGRAEGLLAGKNKDKVNYPAQPKEG